MERNNERYPQQDAPGKNTDNAFVKVGEDGKPEIPENENEQQAQAQKGDTEKES